MKAYRATSEPPLAVHDTFAVSNVIVLVAPPPVTVGEPAAVPPAVYPFAVESSPVTLLYALGVSVVARLELDAARPTLNVSADRSIFFFSRYALKSFTIVQFPAAIVSPCYFVLNPFFTRLSVTAFAIDCDPISTL